MDFDLARKIFNSLYSDVSGYEISSQAKSKLPYADKSLTYGEVVPESFHTIISQIEPKEGEIFYDLGSGTGKAVILASLFFRFSKVFGLEKLEDLWKCSRDVLQRFETEFKGLLPKDAQTSIIDFINEDFLEYDFSDADIVFTHSTCFSEELMENVKRRLERLKKGARVITATKTLDSGLFTLIKQEEYQFSWGRATVYFYTKIL